MSDYNFFGATYARLLEMYPGTTADDFGGEEAIEDALARASREVAGAFAPVSYNHLAEEITLELVEDYATADQVLVQLGVTPIVAGTLRLWRFYRGQELNEKPVWGYLELAHTVVVATGVATLSSGLSLGDRVFATYVIDTEADAFSWPSVADVVLLGAAAELGARIYTSADQVWALVEDYKERYRGRYVVQEGGALGMTRSGNWVPDELRTLKFWTEVERASSMVSSVPRRRA